MGQLQIGLAILGGLLLAAVVAYNTWTTRRGRPRQPSVTAEQTAAAPGAASGAAQIEPELDAAAMDLATFPLTPAEKHAALDALIDVIAPITLDTPVAGEVALAALPATRRAGSKPFSIEGCNALSGRWELPVAGQRYSQFQAGVQLANRSGALNDIEFSEFVVKTQAFCDTLNATADFPDMREAVARARELDQFASDHDAQLGFVLRARNAAWSPGFVQQHAARLGFVAGAMPGRMVVPSSLPGLPAVLGLGFDAQAALAEDPTQSAIREIHLSLDVAQVERGERAFARMREAALALAQSMDGVVTDDNGVLLPEAALDVIGTELERLYDTLEQRDLAAGSVIARRLFS